MSAQATRESSPPGLAALLEENAEKVLTCVHCGLCLPSCPTYRQLGNENDSPRGRIYLMRGHVEGKLEMGSAFVSHIDLCLGCRACETVCPSGVPYGELLEGARAEIAASQKNQSRLMAMAVRLVLNSVFTRPWLLGFMMRIARWFRDSDLALLVLDSGFMPRRLRFALALLAASKSPLKRSGYRAEAASRPDGDAVRASVLRGCVMEGLFAETNRDTESVLARNGFDLVDAPQQGCCGALHAHSGQLETARELARKNIDAFESAGSALIVTNAAGCGAAMKEYGHLLKHDDRYSARAAEFAGRVRDIFELLADTELQPPSGKVSRSVAYDAPCHLIHAQRIASAPVQVMKEIPGLRLAPLEGFESCCGGAGIYNLQHPDLSRQILNEKLKAIEKSGADTVATANPGCIMQIGAGALLGGLKIDVVHPIELLGAAYRADSGTP